MTGVQLRLMATLLREAADVFAGRISDILELPNTPENRALVDAAQHWNAPHGPELEWEIAVSPDGSAIDTANSFMAEYLAHLAEDEAKGK